MKLEGVDMNCFDQRVPVKNDKKDPIPSSVVYAFCQSDVFMKKDQKIRM
jgi:hypothetical protein